MKCVAVVVPTYNDSISLIKTVKALDRQSIREDLEIVVSRDGGDSVQDEIRYYADRIVDGEHLGPAAARNRGWKSTVAKFILFTDSDCIPEPDWAEKMLEPLKAGWDGAKGTYSSGGSRIIQRLSQIEFEERYRLLEKAKGIDLVDTYSAGFRREALENVDGFDETFPVPDHEDVDLSYRMKKKGFRFVFVRDARVNHLHRSTWNDYFRLKMSRGKWKMKVLHRFPEKAFSDSYTPVCMKIQILLSAILLPAAIGAFLFPLVALAWIILFLFSLLPLILITYEKAPVLIPFVPFFALWRGTAFLLGLAAGLKGGSPK